MATAQDYLARCLAAFEQAVGRDLLPEHKRRLLDIAKRFYPPSFLDMMMDDIATDLNLQDPIRPAVRKKWLANIAKQAEALRTLITLDDDEPDEGSAGKDLTRTRIVEELLPYSEHAAMDKALKKLNAEANKLHRMAKDRGGRIGNLWVREIVGNLAALYRDVTGNKPKRQIDKATSKPQGPLFDFVKAFFVSFAARTTIPTDGAIDEAIRYKLYPRKH